MPTADRPHIMPSTADISFMQQAVFLAQQAKDTLPNPRVGAVIVRKNNVIAGGFHRGPGRPHAEVEAIRAAEKKGVRRFDDCSLYVTLEPCCHLKKRTPPCAPILVQKNFKRIVVAHLDPNPLVSGRGVSLLRKAGLKVSVGCEEKAALALNQDFIKNQTKKLPYVTMKLALTFDGKMADDLGQSKWITSEEARADAQWLRLEADALGVGKNTVTRDNPRLNVRLKNKSLPRKIVIFGQPQKFSKNFKLVRANGIENVVIIRERNLRKALQNLYQKNGICHLLVEGGPHLASQFLKAGLVDKAVFYLGRGILGGLGHFSLGRAWGLKKLPQSIRFWPEDVRLLGPDVRIQGRFHVYGPHSKSR